MTSSDLYHRLALRYAAPAWAVFPEFRSETGAVNAKYADAIAVSLFPSRGLEIYGFEIKISKSDLRSELLDPKKADAIGKFCSRWFLVISDPSVVEGLDIPKKWGVLQPKGEGLHLAKKAEENEVVPPTIQLVCSMARRVTDNEFVPRREVETQIQRRLQEQRAADTKYARDIESQELSHLKMQHEWLVKSVKSFEEKSGIALDKYDGGNVAQGFKLAKKGLETYDYASSTLSSVILRLDESLKNLKNEQDRIKEIGA